MIYANTFVRMLDQGVHRRVWGHRNWSFLELQQTGEGQKELVSDKIEIIIVTVTIAFFIHTCHIIKLVYLGAELRELQKQINQLSNPSHPEEVEDLRN